MKKIALIIISLMVAFFMQACASLRPQVEALDALRDALAREAGPLDTARVPQTGPLVAEYFANADLLEPGYSFPGTRIMGTITTAGYRLGAVLLLPAAPARGTIIAWHGYSGYSALNLSALYRLVEDGWSVLAVDLPGHGFSSGPAGDIGDFSDYGACVRGAIDWRNSQKAFSLPLPLVLLGHSTGGAAVLEALWQRSTDIDRVVLLAPLIDLGSSGFASCMVGGASLFAPDGRVTGRRSGYLSPYEIPFTWVKALGRWRAKLDERPTIATPLLMLQGDADKVLDWRSNIDDLKRFAPDAVVLVLRGRGHTLFDRSAAQAKALAAIREFLAVPFDKTAAGVSHRTGVW
jgi:alpha-beta hydrolase superfamily lysophospholipase